MKKILTILVTAVLMFGMVCVANASTLTSTISMDNGYEVFISTSDSSEGTSFGAHNNWFIAYTDSTTLADGTDYYLHVYGYNQGAIAGFLGQFTLTGTDHEFSNGGSTLYTNVADWKGNNTGWGNPYLSLTDVWANDGSSPNWGSWVQGISATAHWVWAGDEWNNYSAYFSTKISSKSGTVSVPEPTTMLFLGLGLVGLAGLRRKFKK